MSTKKADPVCEAVVPASDLRALSIRFIGCSDEDCSADTIQQFPAYLRALAPYEAAVLKWIRASEANAREFLEDPRAAFLKAGAPEELLAKLPGAEPETLRGLAAAVNVPSTNLVVR